MIGFEIVGGLGNQMFQYAYIRTVAEKNNYKFSICTDNYIGTWVEFLLTETFPELLLNYNLPNNYINRISDEGFDYKEHLLNLQDNVKVTGFFQNYKYFKNSPVKDWFKIKFSEKEQYIANEFLRNYPPYEYTYVHFRGGDFYHTNSDNDCVRTEIEFYDRAKNYVDIKKFVCITDDPERAKIHTGINECICNTPRIDLFLLEQSKNLIIPYYTTFSWWGAYLSNAEKIITPINRGKRGCSAIETEGFTYI